VAAVGGVFARLAVVGGMILVYSLSGCQQSDDTTADATQVTPSPSADRSPAEALVVRFCACAVSLTVHERVKLGDPVSPIRVPETRSPFHPHNETFSVVAMCVGNPDRLALCTVATFGLPKASAACQGIGS
jgi:hypothetical protein